MVAHVRAALTAVAAYLRRLAGWRSSPVVALVRVLPRVSPAGTPILAFLVGLGAILPVARMVATGWLLGAMPATVRAGLDSADGRRALTALAAVVAITVLMRITNPVTTLLSRWLGRRLAVHLTGRVLAAANRPVGIGHLEDPALADHINLAQGVSTGRLTPDQAVPALTTVVGARLNAATVAVTLGLVVWWAPLPLIATWVPVGRWMLTRMRLVLRGVENDTASLRRATYLRSVGIDPAPAKDVRVFGLAGWALGEFTDAWLAGMSELFWRGGRWRGFAVTGAALVAAYTVVLLPLTLAASRGEVSLTALLVAAQTAMGMSAFGPLGDSTWTLASASAAIPHALALDAAVGAATVEPDRRAAHRLASGERGLRFAGVGFGYPGRPDVLDKVDLWVPDGSSVALVGDNGAGKTTLVKLIAKLYEPDRGAITVDGVDLRDVDPVEWRRRLAVVFQDFTRYELTARENVAMGASVDPTDDELDEVLELAGGGDFVGRLSAGWDTVLSRRFTGGVDLSGGQWQRIALARALYAVRHGARILILDEPTAHLDVRAESELYDRFLDLTRGVTTILVSHRFATVRLADTICVLDAGRVTELGRHDDLVARGGRYARMFAAQSARFLGGVR
ncbi:MAG TPA: ABC transporter ATP-binding protein [Mycobacteriales bacterium]|nr:ABC transporter ATP-binding protein [Mycobacteriales bacterium]